MAPVDMRLDSNGDDNLLNLALFEKGDDPH